MDQLSALVLQLHVDILESDGDMVDATANSHLSSYVLSKAICAF